MLDLVRLTKGARSQSPSSYFIGSKKKKDVPRGVKRQDECGTVGEAKSYVDCDPVADETGS